jgi:hypothetical protein
MHRILTALCLLCFSIASQGAIYKWVDQDGVTQFSQFPPPEQAAEQIAPAPPPSGDPAQQQERLQQQMEGFDARRQAEAESRQAQEREKEQQALRKRNCEVARHNLELLQRGGRTRFETESGEVAYLTDAQRQERLETARQAVQEHCD